MKTFYTDDKTTQIVLSLLKAHGIRKIIVSPGTTNVALVGSMQQDEFFDMYSAVDERSAAYMACGLAYESGEPVVITCTEATASRNYFPGLTEAYYRKLPILAITGTHGSKNVGHLKPQSIDRSVAPNDTIRMSIDLGKCQEPTDEWYVNVKVNEAILELTRDGGGPVHINLPFSCNTYNTKQLPNVRVIKRFKRTDNLPPFPCGRIAIFIGSHKMMNTKEVELIDSFCDHHNAAVLCDKTSGYYGRYRIDYSLIAAQQSYNSPTANVDLLIHIGEVSGDTYTQGKLKAKETWRVSDDGLIKDTFHTLKYVFSMEETEFFNFYQKNSATESKEYFNECKEEYEYIYGKQPEIPYSNIWVAKMLCDKIPEGSYLHLSIFNSLRSWNFIKITKPVYTICNVGGFGIDGPMSTAIGATLAHPDILHFLIIGDLAFFYDLNSLGNRHVNSNLRILLINNGRGTEFRKKDHACAVFGDDADAFMAAAGHFGCQSKTLVRDYVQNLGFDYMQASSKEEFLNLYKGFTSLQKTDKPIVFEAFTDYRDETTAVDAYRHIVKDSITDLTNKVKHKLKSILS
ncbi:2-succinyl-5-enolpyruvyl-6-hydroxy-3-cyclohexene -1-carboxylic-acidsynthase [Phocaeicola salanitronis DSM 18170]|uniref:2-succinyl-5-enolpyruvyl-6-hydroxy-3-cyclohexene-1-carboxylic-acidsynthase n=1 Tax=Phocaeicola salanitronis (strain DSM 18170 / JCM 13657 / CCUG 60908 / BL78) TaxID=667015 RepID=F0R6S8_PHOSB|nr:thiamine pyrophosphate-binding protein [Phocaeicola salanitronis]ADY37983.1 2-succinyl-5-enolpyruvyl-6-hydroxy-3-cyclohexene -1-carboxylic-acidsynthase [Phocaeicola salanitronis DSM 18170]